MKTDHHTRANSIRYEDWDYANSFSYFITINTRNSYHWFGEINNKAFIANELGEIAKQNWQEIENRFDHFKIGKYVIMPNHLHGIIRITRTIKSDLNPTEVNGGSTGINNPMLHKNLSTAMRWFKGRTTFDCRKIDPAFGWHRSFYDHIIWDKKSQKKIELYIENNPINWK